MRRPAPDRAPGSGDGTGRSWRILAAAAAGLSGSVRNDSAGALIEIEGTPDDIDRFLTRLRGDPPP
ncbi:hypothetical protein C6A85_05595, partial [Mycobacterium sp. ITM-2017-0098]